MIKGILFSIFFILSLYTSFLTSFLLHYLVYLNQQEKVLIYQHLIYLLYFLIYLNQYEVFNFSICILSALAFKLARSDFAANLDVSTPVAFFKSNFVP